MPRLPAVCPHCREVFPSFIEASPEVSVHISNVRMQCPHCGGLGYIPDGLYGSIESVTRHILASRTAARDIETLRDIFHVAKEKGSTPEEVKAAIKERLPELTTLRTYFPKTRAGFANYILAFATLLAALATIIIPLLTRQPTLDKSQIEEIVNQTIEKTTSEKTVPVKNFRRKLGRNELCPCGSGKKYKKCCLNAANKAR